MWRVVDPVVRGGSARVGKRDKLVCGMKRKKRRKDNGRDKKIGGKLVVVEACDYLLREGNEKKNKQEEDEKTPRFGREGESEEESEV
jgi:hypothetical protein